MLEDAKMAEHFEVLEELGSGSFGVVYKGIDKTTGEVVAIKHIDLESSEDDIQDIQQEISVLSTCDSPFVTQYKASFLRGHKLWIVMEYLGGGSCLDLLKAGPFEETYIAVICRELLLGLDYLHKEGKIHRDVKAANILLAQSGRVKLADFGVAAQLTNIKSQRNTFVGTPFWMAPEVIQQAGYDFKADIWSLGVTAMEMVQGEPPNASTHPMKALFLIPKAPAPRLDGNEYSKNLKDFVAACLIKDPDRRPTANELLQHRFIRNAGSTESLQELISRRLSCDTSGAKETYPKYYEETLCPREGGQREDEWVFETVRATPMTPHHAWQDISPNKIRSQNDVGSPGSHVASKKPRDPSTGAGPIQSTLGSFVHKDTAIRRRPSATNNSTRIRIKSDGKRKPLAPSLDFGNSASTTRQVQRLYEDREVGYGNSSNTADENQRPKADELSKEALLGRSAFSNAINPAIREVSSRTTCPRTREHLSRIASAWDALDQEDAEGEHHLLGLIFEKVQRDPRLAPMLCHLEETTPRTPKLILAQNNPHLKSHRRRQSSLLCETEGYAGIMSGLPGNLLPGMEHTKQLADVLYLKWTEGLINRWPNL